LTKGIKYAKIIKIAHIENLIIFIGVMMDNQKLAEYLQEVQKNFEDECQSILKNNSEHLQQQQIDYFNQLVNNAKLTQNQRIEDAYRSHEIALSKAEKHAGRIKDVYIRIAEQNLQQDLIFAESMANGLIKELKKNLL